MNFQRVLLGCTLMILLGLSTTAFAGTIGPSCGSCFGGIYNLDATLTAEDSTTQTYLVTYSLDLSGVNVSGVTYVGQIAAKLVAGPNFVSAVLVSPPTGNLTDMLYWSQSTGNLNNNGCDGSGGGWVCLAWTGPAGTEMTVGNPTDKYSWQFLLKVKKNTLQTDASIQANFDPATGILMSEKIHVPEPSSAEDLALGLGWGFLLLWWYNRRRIASKPTDL
jgi:hypothetical protein